MIHPKLLNCPAALPSVKCFVRGGSVMTLFLLSQSIISEYSNALKQILGTTKWRNSPCCWPSWRALLILSTASCRADCLKKNIVLRPMALLNPVITVWTVFTFHRTASLEVCSRDERRMRFFRWWGRPLSKDLLKGTGFSESSRRNGANHRCTMVEAWFQTK